SAESAGGPASGRHAGCLQRHPDHRRDHRLRDDLRCQLRRRARRPDGGYCILPGFRRAYRTYLLFDGSRDVPARQDRLGVRRPLRRRPRPNRGATSYRTRDYRTPAGCAARALPDETPSQREAGLIDRSCK
ncbi:hypothetical protein PMAYCL1PPCAC_11040, partial [Pristionchus mayeri]